MSDIIGKEEMEANLMAGPAPRMARPWEYSKIPALVRETIDEYVRIGRPVGGFVDSVLCNDLTGALARADICSMPAIPAICGYVYNECPSRCWGSREMVDAWMQEFADERSRERERTLEEKKK